LSQSESKVKVENEEVEEEEDKETDKEIAQSSDTSVKIDYTILGSETCPVNEDDEGI
jgi:hypothetical protein